ncbi:undecaprenyl-diphosphate phosphatase [Thermodesulfobacteriota bacterium]
MDPLQAAVLGIVQGLTEFLPISSSGHLVIFQHLFGLKEPELLFDICVHVGTLFAVCVVFFREIRSILLTLIRLPKLAPSLNGLTHLYAENEEIRIATLIVIGNVPTAILGLMFNKIAEQIFGSLEIVGFMLLITGALLWLTRRTGIKGRPLRAVTIKDALVIGLVQGMAILPGISRSGVTISVALFLGVDREVAGRYSFLLSIPAIIGALLQKHFQGYISDNSCGQDSR